MNRCTDLAVKVKSKTINCIPSYTFNNEISDCLSNMYLIILQLLTKIFGSETFGYDHERRLLDTLLRKYDPHTAPFADNLTRVETTPKQSGNK